jgi:hypothetical protein
LEDGIPRPAAAIPELADGVLQAAGRIPQPEDDVPRLEVVIPQTTDGISKQDGQTDFDVARDFYPHLIFVRR